MYKDEETSRCNLKMVVICSIVFVLILSLFVLFTNKAEAFNYTLFDLKYQFNYAIIYLNGITVAEGTVTQWKDWEDSDGIQVEIDGITYYTHLCNVVLESR